MPRLRRWKGICRRSRRLRLRSLTITSPLLGRSIRAMSLSTVLLPAPEWPARTITSPRATRKLTSRSASWPPALRLPTWSNWIMISRGHRSVARIISSPRKDRTLRLRLAREQGLDEIAGIERPQVVDAFADADETDRQLHLLGNCENNAALGGAVELGEDEAGETYRLVELARLIERILAGAGVDHEQGLVRRGGLELGHHAFDLFELFYYFRLRVQTSRRGGDEHVGAARLRRLQRIEDDRGRISRACLRDHSDVVALAPGLQLLHCRGAEGVAGREHHRVPLRLQIFRELADGGGLAHAVHAHHQDHIGPLVRGDGERHAAGREDGVHVFLE